VTQIAGERRFGEVGSSEKEKFPARILSLLLDRRCEALVVSCTADEIREFGLPHATFVLVLVAAQDGLADELRAFIETHSSQMIENVYLDHLNEHVFSEVSKLMGEPRAILEASVERVLTTSVTRLGFE
jgi:hypothetical protein